MLTETGSQWNVHINPCAETLDAKRQKKSNSKAPSVSLFGICFTLVSLVLIVFCGFDNCEDLVTGASERKVMSKAKHLSV